MRSRVYRQSGGVHVVVCVVAEGLCVARRSLDQVWDIIHGGARRSRKLQTRFDPGKLMPLEISHSDVLAHSARLAWHAALSAACTSRVRAITGRRPIFNWYRESFIKPRPYMPIYDGNFYYDDITIADFRRSRMAEFPASLFLLFTRPLFVRRYSPRVLPEGRVNGNYVPPSVRFDSTSGFGILCTAVKFRFHPLGSAVSHPRSENSITEKERKRERERERERFRRLWIVEGGVTIILRLRRGGVNTSAATLDRKPRVDIRRVIIASKAAIRFHPVRFVQTKGAA